MLGDRGVGRARGTPKKNLTSIFFFFLTRVLHSSPLIKISFLKLYILNLGLFPLCTLSILIESHWLATISFFLLELVELSTIQVVL